MEAVKTKWSIDTAHSEVLFKVKHLVISTVTGSFSDFNATIESENDDFTDATVYFEADVNTISTKNADRDAHLKSDDFFNVEKYSKITFQGKSFTKKDEDTYLVKGDLTIRDVTKEVVLNVTYGGTVTDPWGNIKAGFEITGTINRKEFGLNWSAVTEAGGLVVSDDVKLVINAEFSRN